MANICEFTLVVVAKSKSYLDKFESILITNGTNFNNNRYIAGICSCERIEFIKGNYNCAAVYVGECKWSAYSCFRKGEYTYFNDKYKYDNLGNRTCLEDLSKELNLEIELFGKESGMSFSEYCHIKDGEIIEDATGYYESPIIKDYETYEDFIKDENNKGYVHMTEEIFNNAKREGLAYVDLVEYEYPDNSKLNLHVIEHSQSSYTKINDIIYYIKYAQACKSYCDYIYEHINNVQKVYEQLKDFLEEYFELNSEAFANNIKNHDISKFHRIEFEGYRARFFPVDEEETEYLNKYNPEYFKTAWEFHYKHNPHHPEFYTAIRDRSKSNEIPEMPDVYIAEMICDLWAMSLKFNNTPLEYIKSNESEFKDIMNSKSYNKLIDALYNIEVNNLMEGLYNMNSMRKVKDYTCPKCKSDNIVREGPDDIIDNGSDYIEYTCANCGYNLAWCIPDYSDEYGGMSEEKFHRVWDSGLYDSGNLVLINNKLTQDILHEI